MIAIDEPWNQELLCTVLKKYVRIVRIYALYDTASWEHASGSNKIRSSLVNMFFIRSNIILYKINVCLFAW